MHCKNAVALFGRRALDRSNEHGAFPIPGGPLGGRHGPRKTFSKSQGASKMAASSIHCIVKVCRDHPDERRKAIKKKGST